MALILNETFATGIPGDFATARTSGGSLTTTWNDTAQAVDIGNTTAAHSIWDITSVPLSASGEMEIDLEFLADHSGSSNYRSAGAWAVAGEAAVSNGIMFRHWQTKYERYEWTGATSWGGNGGVMQVSQGPSTPFTTAGDRRVFNIRWDMSSTAGIKTLAAECRLDGALILVGATRYASLRPGINVYQSAVRLHSIKVWDAPQAPLADIGVRGFDASVSRRICAPPEALLPGGPQNRNRGLPLGWRNTYQGGGGRVAGTVKEKNLPVNTPLRRRVQLIDEGTRLLVRELWSDALTGAYSFDYVDPTRKYTVLAYDYAQNYRAVLADNITPEIIA